VRDFTIESLNIKRIWNHSNQRFARRCGFLYNDQRNLESFQTRGHMENPMQGEKLALYRDALQRAGLRMTAPRRAICDWLAATDAHPTPYQVYEQISRTHPEISRATVYNTLNTLQQLGAIVELGVGANHTHYDTNPQPHVNLICLRCHQITDLDAAAPFADLRTLLDHERGFHALVARAEVLGLCAGCFAAEPRDGAAAAAPDGESDSPLPAAPSPRKAAHA
jgi:Fur family peroxide stress response transcriptional regulator